MSADDVREACRKVAREALIEINRRRRRHTLSDAADMVADAVLDALVDAGMLAETHTEWGVRVRGVKDAVTEFDSGGRISSKNGARLAAVRDYRKGWAKPVRREVTDWREVRDVD